MEYTTSLQGGPKSSSGTTNETNSTGETKFQRRGSNESETKFQRRGSNDDDADHASKRTSLNRLARMENANAASAKPNSSGAVTGRSHFMNMHTSRDRKLVEEKNESSLIFPWSRKYKFWYGWTVLAAVITILQATYQIAFDDVGSLTDKYTDPSAILEYILAFTLAVDMLVTFNLAFYDQNDNLIQDRKMIAQNYLRFMFWIDLIGVFPFYAVALSMAGHHAEDDSDLAHYLSFFLLFKLVRIHRIKKLAMLQYSTKISLIWLTLIRNFSVALVWTHLNACIMYFIARQYSFNESETWIGFKIDELNNFERYVAALYFSVVTFTTVGYGDYTLDNPAEQIWGMLYMLLNIIMGSWIIGSITLLVVKNDEKTGDFRELMHALQQYSAVNNFDRELYKRLKTQVKLDFGSNSISDEEILQHFPGSVRRKVLRKLYLPSLYKTSLLKGTRNHFMDVFLANCSIELFSPGEDIIERGSTSSDLYLLVKGVVDVIPANRGEGGSNAYLLEANPFAMESSHPGSGNNEDEGEIKQLHEGDFINEIGFFTESPQPETIRTLTVCKTLTMPMAAFKIIRDDHSGSVGKILKNLLAKVERLSQEQSMRKIPVYDNGDGGGRPSLVRNNNSEHDLDHAAQISRGEDFVRSETDLTVLRDLVKKHIEKQKDHQTLKFLFAASRGDIPTIALLCSQGFDPDNSDYDNRTALMVAATRGHTATVEKLLHFDANPNLVDIHGSSALYSATKNGHEETMKVLLKAGAELCIEESDAASILCQTVYDGDNVKLRRLLQARIQVNAADYDGRTAGHIAASEGNRATLKLLEDFGADLSLQDRWSNTVQDELDKFCTGHCDHDYSERDE
eukprot:CAMPEP_0195307556 /NCGR_PEP_ID=MMETSP0707-20130614/37777_1 /TAXON_ID=33640 /ORGANISM="Asterionellopsis glacialis, Strain CCMP134" /LENGTH=851 /DNA_ID=CAMNT_0040371809 /DNA_START=95 /DNA_END=2653 /DNA_ORIENTATION=+